MSHASPAPSDLLASRLALRARRVRNLTLLTMLGMVLSLVLNFAQNAVHANAFIIGAIAALGVGYLCSRRGLVEPAAAILLWTTTIALSALMWAGDGLRDPALAAYAGVLLFGAMLGHARTVPAVLAAMIANMIALAAADITGTSVHGVAPLTWGHLVDHAVILVVIAMTAWWLAGDLRRALATLERENERIRYLSHHDALTGLPNRAFAQEHFERAGAAARRAGRRMAILYLDLDHFKVVNDTLGHPMGDRLLQAVAERLTGLVRSADVLCRFGGDEFLVLLTALEAPHEASRVAAQIVESLSQPVTLDGHVVPCGCSLGVVVFPDDADTFDELVRRADLAMYKAKEAGRHGFHFYDEQLHSAVEHQLRVDAAMRASLATGEGFHLLYQPQCDLRSGRVVGFEALLRWHHPEMGDVPPGRFIPQAERSGFIVALGAWVLESACRQAQAWRVAGMGDLPISVNVSPVQMRRGHFADTVRNVLAQTGLAPGALELELTESLLVDDASGSARALHDIAGQGVLLAIDDFGTGYSNLGYLRRFQIERLKIDRSFIQRITQSPHDEAIVRAIVQMSSSLGIVTVAEGIETEEVRARLQSIGCDHGQGWLWHPALTPEACEALWRADARRVQEAATPG